jgi:hypothetical protein
MSNQLKILLLSLIAVVFTSCADAFAAAGYLLGLMIEWTLILAGIGIALWIVVLIIMWIASWFK